MFEKHDDQGHRRVIRLKRGMAAVRRILGPQRDTLLALTRDEFRPDSGRDAAVPARRLRPLGEARRLARLVPRRNGGAARATGFHDLEPLNEIIKRLTVIATIGLPLTVVTSYYGMNFQLVEYRWPHAWLYVLGLIAASGLLTWLVSQAQTTALAIEYHSTTGAG